MANHTVLPLPLHLFADCPHQVKHFQGHGAPSTSQLGLKSAPAAKGKALKMSEIKQAEAEQKLIEERQHEMSAGAVKTHRVKGETRAEWEREQRMAKSEWKADEGQVSKSFYTEGKQDAEERRMEEAERRREAKFHDREQHLRKPDDSYDRMEQEALKTERAKHKVEV